MGKINRLSQEEWEEIISNPTPENMERAIKHMETTIAAATPKKPPVYPMKDNLGTFEVVSNAVRVTDPCYDRQTWCAGTIKNVRNGTYKVHVERSDEKDWGMRVAKLVAVHSDIKDLSAVYDKTQESFEVGVDSGQAGIFDDDHYTGRAGKADWIDEKDFSKEDGPWGKHTFNPKSEEPFYDACGSHTLSHRQAGVLKYGAVSSSGYGDGGYTCYTYRIGDEVVGIEIDYELGDEEDER